MRLLLLLLLNLLSVYALASPMETVVDFLKETPARVEGDLRLASPLNLYRGKWGIINLNMQVHPQKTVGFSFSQEHLSLHTEDAIELSVGGVPVKIKSVYYHEKTGKFSVKTDTPMGLFEGGLNDYIADELNKHYKPRVLEAFAKLKTIKEQKNLNDMKKITDSVVEIFARDTDKSTAPDIEGRVDLVFTPPESKKLQIEEMTAHVQAKDRIAAGVSFHRSDNQIQVTGMHMHSAKGIRVHGETKWPEIKSINMRSVQISDAGIKTDYEIGGEEVVGGLMLMFKVLEAQGNPNAANDCVTMPKFETIRAQLDEKFQEEVGVLVRRHQAELLRAGVNQELLAAFK